MAVFAIAPAPGRFLWLLVPVVLVLIGVFVLLAASIRGAHASRFEVLDDSLRLRGDLYGRTIPRCQLLIDSARRVNFASEPGLLPKWKRVGTGLPGYQSGWFRLRNGEKALLYLTDRSKAVYIPTSNGYGLLLSPLDPDGFLAALRQRPQ
jgi:hypothetical protein